MARGRPAEQAKSIHYAEIAADVRRADKLKWVVEQKSVAGAVWTNLRPDEKHSWLVPENADDFATYISIANKAARLAAATNVQTIFKDYSLGVATHRDAVVYDFSRDELKRRIYGFIDDYNSEVDRWKRAPKNATVDAFVKYDKIRWDRDLKKDLYRGRYADFQEKKIRIASYRPFCKHFLYFDRILNAEVYGFPNISPTQRAGEENPIIACSDLAYRASTFSALMTNNVVDLHLCATLDGHECFPFYIYDEDGSNRRENITDWALNQFRSHYNDKKISKWDIFHYVYALLHHLGYRSKFADNLKRELPRIPFAPAVPKSPGIAIPGLDEGPRDPIRGLSSGFWAFSRAGKKLTDLHLHYEAAKEFPLQEIVTTGHRRSARVESKMKLSKDKRSLMVNESLTLTGIPPGAFDYRLGNRSALDWIIDQYQVYTDPRTNITSDPNAWGEEHGNSEYIVQLVGKIIGVSVETQKIIGGLPVNFSEDGSGSI